MFTFSSNNVSGIKNEIGTLLRKMRKTNSLSQQQLADLLNLSRITIQNVESGKNFTIDVLLLILQHFNELDSFNTYIKVKSEEYDNLDSLY
ncbi:helix-turn-helix transcriptional regulator [Algoriphagus aquimarinus]|uniref:Helix-turn-helix transcriptional regulator n=1 Tax=Algoriphagus aquimarinus TaxID=237018 RepID=A0A5C7ABV5_9BACT|nr:helix-turn-helix transcriptional regulator [Algoriphagus aquimarinus]TXE04755.1 helix-turn-helix transcriptional regulator [Algoriphagus aquimarinus]